MRATMIGKPILWCINLHLRQVSSATALQDFLGSIVEATAKRYGVKLTENKYQRKLDSY